MCFSSVVRAFCENFIGHGYNPIKKICQDWHEDYPVTSKAAGSSVLEEFSHILNFLLCCDPTILRIGNFCKL
jgi:hypothetical protein